MYVFCVLFYEDADSGTNGNYNIFEVGLRDEWMYFKYFDDILFLDNITILVDNDLPPYSKSLNGY